MASPLLHEVEMPALPYGTGEGGNLSQVWNPEILPEFAASWPALRIFNLPAPHKHMSQLLKISICSLSLSPSKKDTYTYQEEYMDIFLLVLFLSRTLTDPPCKGK